MKNKRKIGILLILSIVLILAFVFIGMNSKNRDYFISRRVPKVVAIVITGLSIGLSTTIFQTVSNNRILTPSVLGLDSLYMLIQTGVIFLLGSTNIFILNKNLNFIVTVGLMVFFSGLIYKALFNKEEGNIMTLLLVGLILGTLFQSLSSFMQMMIDPNEFLHVQDKMFASFNNINTKILLLSAIVVILITVYVYRYAKSLDVLSLGREHAINLGIDNDKLIQRMLFMVSILISVSTALVGPITFLGLLVVNLAREFLDTYEHKYLIITSSLLGIIALVGGQLLVERVFNFSTPISVIINFVGGIYFIYLLLKENMA